MTSFIQDLRGVFTAHIEKATAVDLINMASTLCAADEPLKQGESPQLSGRFQVHGDVVNDLRTGLMWTRETLTGGRREWAAANQAATESRVAGYTDWRLPTIAELLTLVDYERSNPAIDPAFKCEPAWYWTSTPYAPSPGDYAWYVDFCSGYSDWYGQRHEGFVRAVRAGQLTGFFGPR
jgi:hypothetical protein